MIFGVSAGSEFDLRTSDSEAQRMDGTSDLEARRAAHCEVMDRMMGVPIPLDKRTDFARVCCIAVLLSAVSGMVNVLAFMELGAVVAHQSGNTAHIGRLLSSGEHSGASRIFGIAVAYLVGAAAAGFGSADGEAVFAGRPSPLLFGSALAVAAGAVLQHTTGNVVLTLLLWSFSQGLQNGVTSRFSSLPLRTTHMTGALTDAGIVLGQWLKARSRGRPLPAMHKPILFLLCTFGFGFGGFAAHLGHNSFEALAALFPAFALAAASAGLLGRPGGDPIAKED